MCGSCWNDIVAVQTINNQVYAIQMEALLQIPFYSFVMSSIDQASSIASRLLLASFCRPDAIQRWQACWP
jgi:hypothetical protein